MNRNMNKHYIKTPCRSPLRSPRYPFLFRHRREIHHREMVPISLRSLRRRLELRLGGALARGREEWGSWPGGVMEIPKIY
jgi:hypothetical protein